MQRLKIALAKKSQRGKDIWTRLPTQINRRDGWTTFPESGRDDKECRILKSLSLRSVTLFSAGLLGFAGVAGAAAAAHGGDSRLLGAASALCLAHAPALTALAAGWPHIRTAALAAPLMAVGTALFSADLASRYFLGNGVFPLSAPTGGLMTMAGWIALGAGAFFPMRDP